MSIPRTTRSNRFETVIDHVNRMLRGGSIGRSQSGSGGLAFNPPPAALGAWFRLQTDFTYPPIADASQEHLSVEPTPFATARMLWCAQHDSADLDEQQAPVLSYDGTGLAADVTLYHPRCFRNASGYAIGYPPCAAGDHVYAQYNRQSGRWEIADPPQDTWRFELKHPLVPGAPPNTATHADAYLLRAEGDNFTIDEEVVFTVYDPWGSRRGRARDALDPENVVAGSRGQARYMPDAARWEIVCLQPHARRITCMADGDTASAEVQADVTSVVVTEPYGGILLYEVLVVDNVFEHSITSGERIDAVFNETNGRWEIVQTWCDI